MRRPLYVLALLLAATGVSLGRYSGGTGDPNNPYRIATAEDLNDIGNHVEDFNKCFILVNDVNMAGFMYTTAVIAPDLDNTNLRFDGTPFTGVFEGNDCNIINLTIDTAGADNEYLGLFGMIEDPGEVKNLAVGDVSMTGGPGSRFLGCLCGRNGDMYQLVTGSVTKLGGIIENCYSNGTILGDGSGLGGLVGDNIGGVISKCHSNSEVSGYSFLGGLVGFNGGIILNSYAISSVAGSFAIGGLCGLNAGWVRDCYAMGYVTGGAGSNSLGGLFGVNWGEIRNCYATASVDGNDIVGGLVGSSSSYGSISNCYAVGPVTADSNVGGFVGHHFSCSYWRCFWDTDINPDLSGIGGASDPNVMGKSTAEMQTESTFTDAGWDFVAETANGTSEIWQMPVGDGYPLLSSFQGYKPQQLAGEGTSAHPYLIGNPNELGAIYHYENKLNYQLVADINLSGITWSAPAIPVLGGCLDGNGHVISGLRIQGAGSLGLVLGVEQDGVIMHLSLFDVDIEADRGNYVGGLVAFNAGRISYSCASGTISGNHNVGGLVGSNNNGLVSNCFATVSVSAKDQVGGLVGGNYYGSVSESWAAGSVHGANNVGGLVGQNEEQSSISNSYATGNVTATGDSVGGLVGRNYESSILRCHGTGSVFGKDEVGGLVGDNRGLIYSSYATGSVLGDYGVGGLAGSCGYWWAAGISTSYATASVSGNSSVGGMVGAKHGGRYSSCFWDTNVNPDVNGIGDGNDPNVIGKTTVEMQTKSTFTNAGWDFIGESANGTEDIWDICEGTNYPKLVWQIPAADFLCPDGVDFVDYSFFSDRWQDTNCALANDCDGTDLDFSDVVDWADLKIFCDHWLYEINP